MNSNEIGVYWMPGSPEKGFDLLFLGQGKVRGICDVSCFFKAESNLQKVGISSGLLKEECEQIRPESPW